MVSSICSLKVTRGTKESKSVKQINTLVNIPYGICYLTGGIPQQTSNPIPRVSSTFNIFNYFLDCNFTFALAIFIS